MGIWQWMESDFHEWTDYNGVAFLFELLECTCGCAFSGFEGQTIHVDIRDLRQGRFLLHYV